MRSQVWTSACCVALLIGACPKRQSGPRLGYVAPPPPSASARSEPDSGTWVIEEPAPPEPETAKPASEAPPPAPVPPQRPQKLRRNGVAAEPPSTEPTPEEPSSVEPPPIQPAEGGGGADLRHQIETRQESLSQRIADFEHSRLSDSERHTLDEAKAFLQQSRRALNESDPRRADNLARKADLLITAFKQRH